jgi:hypothetical protein
MSSPLARFVVLSVVAVLAVGCSGKDPNLPELLGVNGVVTLDGQPVQDAVVCFHPIGTTRGTEAFGRTDADGHYELKSRHLGTGTPVGEYRVIVSKFVMPDGSPLPDDKDFDPMTANVRQVLSPQYSNPENSTLKATVPQGGGTIDFPLTSKPQAAKR